MKKHRIISVLVCMAVVAVTLLVVRSPRQLPEEECSHIFRHYAHTEGIKASFIKDFPVPNNGKDTLFVNVTTLHATTPSAWEQLKEDFKIPVPHELIQAKIDSGEDNITVRLCSNKDPREPMDTVNKEQNHVLGFSYLYQTVSIFHTQGKTEIETILFYNLKL